VELRVGREIRFLIKFMKVQLLNWALVSSLRRSLFKLAKAIGVQMLLRLGQVLVAVEKSIHMVHKANTNDIW
jgi:hypothetical protein